MQNTFYYNWTLDMFSSWKTYQRVETCVASKLRIGSLLTKLFWPTVRKKCSCDREKLLEFEAEGQEFAH